MEREMKNDVRCALCIGMFGMGLVALPARAGLLLDYGIMPVDDQFVGIYSSISGSEVIGAFDVHQPFTVTGTQVWDIETVSLFGVGGTGPDVGNTSAIVSIHAWDGSFGSIGSEIVTTIVEFPVLGPFDQGVWIDIDFGPLALRAGEYIISARPTTDDTWALWHNGDTGPEALVHALDQDRIFPQGVSLATRISGSVVPTPGTLGSCAMIGLLAMRRRR